MRRLLSHKDASPLGSLIYEKLKRFEDRVVAQMGVAVLEHCRDSLIPSTGMLESFELLVHTVCVLEKDRVNGLILIRHLAEVLGEGLKETYRMMATRGEPELAASYGSGQVMEEPFPA